MSAVTAFRLGMEGQANEELIAFIDGFPGFLRNRGLSDAAQVNVVLTEILSAQSRKDYLFVADLLEYELSSYMKKILDDFSE